MIKLSIQNGVPSEYTEMTLLQTNLDKVDGTQKVIPTCYSSMMFILFWCRGFHEITLDHLAHNYFLLLVRWLQLQIV